MDKAERLQIFIDYIKKNQPITMKSYLNFADKNNINSLMARRDLKILEHFHYVKIELGLIKISENSITEYEITRDEKIEKNNKEKKLIANEAIKHVNESIIFVSAGTTTEMFVKNINNNVKQLFTNGLEIIKVAQNNPKIDRIISLGGRLRPQSSVFCGPLTNDALESLRFKLSIISVTDVDDEFYIRNNHYEEAEFMKKLISKSEKVIILMDSSKFKNEGFGLCKIEHLSKISTIITDDKNKDLSEIEKLCEVIKVK